MPSGRIPKEGSEWYLPEETYKMVQHFCLSYREMQKKVVELQREIDQLGLVGSPKYDGMPHGTDTTNPTERNALRAKELEAKRNAEIAKIRIIEKAVDATAFTGRKALFLAVTQKVSYDKLRYKVPYGKNQFGKMKQEVYWRVAQEL